MKFNLDLYIALAIVWSIALGVTYRYCVRDSIHRFFRSLRGNRHAHRKALYLSVNHSIRRVK